LGVPGNKGLKALQNRVIQSDFCTICGACACLCPYLKSWRGRIVKLDDCGIDEGRCFAYCPRTEVDLGAVHGAVLGQDWTDVEIGSYRTAVMGRATDPLVRERAQSGGTVSTLISIALEEGFIQAAVLTGQESDLQPGGRIVRDRAGVEALAGSSYVAGPTLEAFNRGPWEADERIGLVALPCQALALGKMRASPLEQRTPIDRISLVVGLFCTWALVGEPFAAFLLERTGGRPVEKLDITPPPERLLKVFAGGQVIELDLDEIRRFIRPGCGVCLDMTAELADVSVGTVEGAPGWNTILVRTKNGEELLGQAERLGALETRPLPEENLAHLKEASLLKKRRAVDALEGQGRLDEGYLAMPEAMIERIRRTKGA